MQIIENAKPNIIFSEISNLTGKMHGFDCLKAIKEIDDLIKVIFLTGNNDHIIVKKAFEMGASGFINKGIGFDDLIDAINVVESGNVYLNLNNDNARLELNKHYGAIDNLEKVRLSKMELETLKLFSYGYQTKEIANKLFLMEIEIDSFRQNFLGKLEAKNLVHAVRIAFDLGLLE